MLKVLLVDDEMFVRKGMHELIDWHVLGMEISGEAENGLEALHMAESLRPDVIITDIRMPVLDGLELIRAIEQLPNLEPVFIIISGYHDFKYAQQAIKYGVHDYILKPIDDEEMTATLQKSANMIHNKRKHAFLAEEQASTFMLEDILKGKLQKEQEHRYTEVLGIHPQGDLMMVLIEPQSGLQERKVNVQRVREVLQVLENEFFSVFVMEQRNRLVLMLIWKENNRKSIVEDKLNCMHKKLSESLKVDIGLYAGTLVNELSDVPRSYVEAEEAIRHKYAEHSGVVRYMEIKEKPLYVFNVNQDDIEPLILSLEERSQAACLQIVNDMFTQFHVRRFSPQAVAGSILRCTTGILAVVHEMGGDDQGLQRLKELAQQSHEGWNLRLLKDAFLVALEEAEEYIAQLRKEQSKGDISKIKRYIDSHYTENISLKSIAALFYVNPVYLGRLFRKSYDLYFNEYLLELRIQEAKKLLRQTDLRMYEVAARVGFQNADYFVTQFEKIVAMSPTSYRNFIKETSERGAQ